MWIFLPFQWTRFALPQIIVSCQWTSLLSVFLSNFLHFLICLPSSIHCPDYWTLLSPVKVSRWGYDSGLATSVNVPKPLLKWARCYSHWKFISATYLMVSSDTLILFIWHFRAVSQQICPCFKHLKFYKRVIFP
jgi:hypothetical protein